MDPHVRLLDGLSVRRSCKIKRIIVIIIQIGSFTFSYITIIRDFVIGENICLFFSARFNGWLWSQNKLKVDAKLPAAREEKNWYS